jgi:hypothetical protein
MKMFSSVIELNVCSMAHKFGIQLFSTLKSPWSRVQVHQAFKESALERQIDHHLSLWSRLCLVPLHSTPDRMLDYSNLIHVIGLHKLEIATPLSGIASLGCGNKNTLDLTDPTTRNEGMWPCVLLGELPTVTFLLYFMISLFFSMERDDA